MAVVIMNARICYYCNEPQTDSEQLRIHVRRSHHITDPSQVNPALQDLYLLGLLPRPRPSYRLQQWFPVTNY